MDVDSILIQRNLHALSRLALKNSSYVFGNDAIQAQPRPPTDEMVHGVVHRPAEMTISLALIHHALDRDASKKEELTFASPDDVDAITGGDSYGSELIVRSVAQRVVVVEQVAPLHLDVRLAPQGYVRVAHDAHAIQRRCH
jgi:hypothetical protein